MMLAVSNRYYYVSAEWMWEENGVKKSKERVIRLSYNSKPSEKTAGKKSPNSRVAKSGEKNRGDTNQNSGSTEVFSELPNVLSKLLQSMASPENFTLQESSNSGVDGSDQKKERVTNQNSGSKGVFWQMRNFFSKRCQKMASTEKSTLEQKSNSEVDESSDLLQCSEGPRQADDTEVETWKTSVSSILEKLISKVATKSNFTSTKEQLDDMHCRFFAQIWGQVQGEDIHVPEENLENLQKNILKSLCEDFQCSEDDVLNFMSVNEPVLNDAIVSNFVNHLRKSPVREGFFSRMWKFLCMNGKRKRETENESSQKSTISESPENLEISESGSSVTEDNLQSVTDATPEQDSLPQDQFIKSDSVECFLSEKHVEEGIEKNASGSSVLNVSTVRDVDSKEKMSEGTHTEVEDSVPESVCHSELSLEEISEPEEQLSASSSQQVSDPKELLTSTPAEGADPKVKHEQGAESSRSSVYELVQLVVSRAVVKLDMQCSSDTIREICNWLFDKIYAAVEGQDFEITEPVLEKMYKKIYKDICKKLKCLEKDLMVLFALKIPLVDDVTVSTFKEHLSESSKKQGFFRRLFL